MPHIRYGYGVPGPAGSDGVIWRANFDLLPLSTSANAATLRAALAAMGLTLTRASAATVQTSASEVVTSGIGVDDPRVGLYGLVVEEARTNEILHARDPQNAVAYAGAGVGGDTATASGLARPDGTIGGNNRIDVPSGSYSRYYVSAARAAGTKWTLSHWLRSFSGTTTTQARFYQSGGGPSHAIANASLGTTWGRVSHTLTATVTNALIFIPEDGRDLFGVAPSGIVTGARNAVHDLTQIEQGAFATEPILTTGAAATRAADLITANDPARMIRSGRLGMEVRFVPKGASADHTGSPYVWWSDAGNNYAYWNAGLGKFLVIIGGATAITSAAFSWVAGDVVDLWIEAGGGTSTIKARTNGGATQNLGTDATVRAAITGANLSLMGRGGAVVTSWLQRMRAYAPGRRPSWCA